MFYILICKEWWNNVFEITYQWIIEKIIILVVTTFFFISFKKTNIQIFMEFLSM